MNYDHICTDTDCPFTGQRTDRGCKCHKTPEQLRDADIITLRQRVTDLLGYNNEFEQRARLADDVPIPEWPIRIERSEAGYSPRLVIEAPDDVTVKLLGHDADED